MDFFDIMFIADYFLFVANLLMMLIFLTFALCPSKGMVMALRLDTPQIKTKDFLEADYYKRTTIISMFSFFILCLLMNILIAMDDYQKNLDIQWFTLIMEFTYVVLLFIGNRKTEIWALIVYVLRSVTVLVWGIWLLN